VVAISIGLWGLETAFNAIGIILLGTVLPLSFLIKNTPEGLGLTMDGDPPARADGMPQAAPKTRQAWIPPVDYSVRGAMRTPTYWVLVLGTALRLIAKGAI
jgi:hypothetical protein